MVISSTPSDAFSERRRTGIGGSDAGAIIGVSPWASRLSVYEEKRGLAPEREAPSERMLWGTRLEGAIIAGYEEDTGLRFVRGGRRFRRHPQMPWVIGHPDAEADDRLLEVKTAAILDERWGEDGSAEIPPHYYAQVQHYMVLRDKALTDVVVLVGGREMHRYSIPRDEPFIAALMEEESRFWYEHVAVGIPPAPDGSESAGEALRRMFPRALPETIPASPAMTETALAWLDAREARDAADQEMSRLAQAMQSYMGARAKMIGPGISVAWGQRAGSPSWKSIAGEALTTLQFIASIPDDAEYGSARAAALEVVEGWNALVKQHTGEPSRPFQVTKVRQEEQP